jgi:hypothetical protein
MDATDLARHTRKALLTIAKQHGIKGVSRLRKKELANRLLQVLSPPPHPAPFAPLPRTNATEQNQQSVETQEAAQQALAVSESPTDQYLTLLAIAPIEQSEQGSTLETMPVSASPPSIAPIEQSEREATDSKFFLGIQPPPVVSEPNVLPASYNDNCIVLLARDPHGVHVYWDFTGDHWTRAQNQRDADDDKLVLRVFDVTYVEFTGTNSWSSMDVELTPFATSWYVAVPRADAAYCAEIGYRSHSGRFISLGRSNVAITPRDEVSPSTTVRWLTPPERRASAQNTTILPYPPHSQERPLWASTPHSTSHLSTPSSLEHSSSSERPSSWGGRTRPDFFPPRVKEPT